MAKKLQPLNEGDLVLTLSLLFPNHLRGGAPRQFDVTVNPETMTLSLEEDMVALTDELDPNENLEAATTAICDAIEEEGISMSGMERHIGKLLDGLIGATP